MAAVALLPSRMDQSDYTIAEQELQDHVLDIYGTRDSDDDMFRPTLADEQKIGFFSLDRAAQTEVTEVVDLKEMTEVLQILLQEVAKLGRDINFTKHAMQADYESKLQSKSLELYCRINERVSELEKIHRDRVSSLRKAFRQQLADAVSRLSVMYKKNLESNMIRERTRQQSDLKGQDVRMQEMKATIARNESIIQMLQLQLQQQQAQTAHHERSFFMDDASSTKSKSTRGTESPVMAMSESPRANSRIQALEDEMEEMRGQQEKLQKKGERLEEALDIKDEEVAGLNKTIKNLQRQVEKEKILNEQLQHEKDEIKMDAEKELFSSKKLLMKQKLEMEQSNSEQIRLAKEEALATAKAEAARLANQDMGKIKELMDQKKELEKELAVERSKASEKSAKGEVEAESLKMSDSKLKAEIKRLKEEIDKVHRTWEKKFTILQASMHALKDESYLRQTLQRQAATLHHASVSYAADTPLGISPSKQNSQATPQKKPLPDIRRNSRSVSRNPNDKDYISYTVSAQSGRGTAAMSVEENQVMSDTEEDLPNDFLPLPEPPARQDQNDAVEESRPSTLSHVVVLPLASV
ncbi:uncharacterized protein C10orf67, mitochondrial-like isoform X1 [Littorina saxatilis]|uniref:DUF4709 domain-containing protein n=1 Tax=Littorina saxatilis TaxID=31220 RepID=A0AAN9GHU7_9CAEN